MVNYEAVRGLLDGCREAGMAVAQDQLDAAFMALADPTRRAIVSRLAHGDATVNELAAPFEMTLPGISKHLKVLERAGRGCPAGRGTSAAAR
jgi:DNA-binding transcriptional ArsR family regulator